MMNLSRFSAWIMTVGAAVAVSAAVSLAPAAQPLWCGSGATVVRSGERAPVTRLAGAAECFPDNLPDEEQERILEESGALPAAIAGKAALADDDRFFHSSTVWTGAGAQGASGLAVPAQLTYSFPDDGTTWGTPGRPIVPSDMNSGLAHVFGGANPDLGREYVRQALAGWRRTTAITYTEVADNNSAMDSNIARVAARGDVRIASGFAWPDSYLAYNFFPSSGGDMFNNSRYWEGNFFARPDNSFRYLRNTEGHEHGHGLGFFHVVPCNLVALMEPFLSTAFDQQQIDEIRNVQRNYGDVHAGNISAATAYNFGNVTAPALRSVIQRTLSINGSDGPGVTGEDWFKFTTSSVQSFTITAVPTGGSYVQGPQSSGCTGTTATVNAAAAGDLEVEMYNQDGSVLWLISIGGGPGVTEIITATNRAAATYSIRVHDLGVNSPVNQVLQTYDLILRFGSTTAAPMAIAGLNKRIMVGATCQFMGDINSYATETGATLTSFDWDLDGNGTFEAAGTPRPTAVYATPGVRSVVLRVTDSNGNTDTDTIQVTVVGAATTLNAVSPYPFRNAQGTGVPVTIFGTGLSGVTSLAELSVSGLGVALSGAPSVNGAGTQISGVSVVVDAGAPKGTRLITVTVPGGTGRAAFYLYPLSPGAFSISAPANGSTTPTAAPAFYWTSSPWAAQYFVQIASDAAIATVVASSPSTITDTAWQSPFGVLTPGNTYYVRIRARNEAGTDAFTPVISFIAGSASGSNDGCANSVTITDGLTPFNSTNATTDGPSEPSCESGDYDEFENDIWYRYTASCFGAVTVSLCGATFDSMLAVYPDVCPLASGSVLACNDDFCGGASQVTFAATPGESRRIRIAGWQGSRGSGVLSISCRPTCGGDADGDGDRDFTDIIVVLANFGVSYGAGATGPGDADRGSDVNFADVTSVLSLFGASCP